MGDRLQEGAAETSVLLTELAPRTASYGLYGSPMAQGMGARIADLRTAVMDRSGDTGLVVRSAVLDMEHVTTLLRQLAELARARADPADRDDSMALLVGDLNKVRQHLGS